MARQSSHGRVAVAFMHLHRLIVFSGMYLSGGHGGQCGTADAARRRGRHQFLSKRVHCAVNVAFCQSRGQSGSDVPWVLAVASLECNPRDRDQDAGGGLRPNLCDGAITISQAFGTIQSNPAREQVPLVERSPLRSSHEWRQPVLFVPRHLGTFGAGHLVAKTGGSQY